jgi:aspartate/methionine/tyrosine aminotransferase
MACCCVGCDAQGALYAFPRITLPDKAHAAAREAKVAPDFLYCKELLDATGIVAVPGSGFKQQEGTFHMRITILPPEEDMAAVIARLSDFHAAFMKRYGA